MENHKMKSRTSNSFSSLSLTTPTTATTARWRHSLNLHPQATQPWTHLVPCKMFILEDTRNLTLKHQMNFKDLIKNLTIYQFMSTTGIARDMLEILVSWMLDMLVLQVVNLANMNKRDTTSVGHLLSRKMKRTCKTINLKLPLIFSQGSGTGGRTISSPTSRVIRSWWASVWATLKPQEPHKLQEMGKYFIRIIMDNSFHLKMLHSKPEITSKARRCNNLKEKMYFQLHKKYREVEVFHYNITITKMSKYRSNI